MAVTYAKHVSTRVTPQSEPIPGKPMVENSAGGYAFALDDWKRLERFLILGNEGGTYYASERALTIENAKCIERCIAAGGVGTVEAIASLSESGRAPKNDAAIFALAVCAANDKTKEAALLAMPRVCRIGTHLFQFVENVKACRGWGRALRRAIGQWYLNRDDLDYQLVKYQQRNGWSHRDLLRLSHPKAEGVRAAMLGWAVGKVESVEGKIAAFEAAKRATDKNEIVRLINNHGLVRECIPTQWLNEPEVWAALLDKMPMHAMVRNLGKMSAIGLTKPMSSASQEVARRLEDETAIRKSRLHPLAILIALRTYASGRGVKGSLAWQADRGIVDALEGAFHKAFENVEPTGKRHLMALDVSGSMECGGVAGSCLSPREASAALAMVTIQREKLTHTVAFTSNGWQCKAAGRGQWAYAGYGNAISQLDFGRTTSLRGAVQKVSGLPMGGTDCALPMLYALEQKIEADVFVVLTDNETWAGSIHPCQALRQYREKMGIPAKLIVVGMTSTGFTIADPSDAGMMDVVGFDASAPAVMSDFAR